MAKIVNDVDAKFSSNQFYYLTSDMEYQNFISTKGK